MREHGRGVVLRCRHGFPQRVDVLPARRCFKQQDRCAAVGIDALIVPGVMPVTNYQQVRRIASLCKARLPEAFTRPFEAAGDDEAEQFEAGVEFAGRQVQGLIEGGVPGIHFYVLNKSLATVRVLEQVGMRR